MPLKYCPGCRKPVKRDDALCACGVDLAWCREELKRLMQPSATWDGKTVVLPFDLFRRLSPQARRKVANAMRRAIEEIKRGHEA